MNRRSFFGSAIGSLAATGVPFVAKPIVLSHDDFPEGVDLLRRFVRLFDLEMRALRKCYLAVETVEGWTFRSPGMASVDRNPETMYLKFFCEDLRLDKCFTLKSVVLHDSLGALRRQSLTAYSCAPGDTLKLTYELKSFLGC